MSTDEERVSITTAERWGCGRGRGAWRALGAEAAGAALLVALSCLATCGPPAPPPPARALAAGLVVALVVQCFDHVSGAQVNPAVTLAAAVVGRVRPAAAALEAAAQLAGAALGAAAARLLAAAPPRDYCVTQPAPALHPAQAVALEALLGACLALANCASWDARNRRLRDSWPLRIGACVAALSFVAGELTGASMNPARSFAPALWSGHWAHHWVYWAGPLGGAALAAALYRAAWPAPAGAPARGGPDPRPDTTAPHLYLKQRCTDEREHRATDQH